MLTVDQLRTRKSGGGDFAMGGPIQPWRTPFSDARRVDFSRASRPSRAGQSALASLLFTP